MFSLSNHQAKIANFNPRAEKHGEQNVMAGDLKIEVAVHSSQLDCFDSQLRPLLFRKADSGEQQSLIAGDDMTGLRVPQIGAIGWEEEFPGYTLTVPTPLGLEQPLVLEQVTLSKFSFEPIQGGAVKITFKASCHPDTDQSGALCTLIQETVDLSLTPPSVPAVQQDDLKQAA